MKRIMNLNLYCGDKDSILDAKGKGMIIINSLRNVNYFPCHKSVVGWTGSGCPKDNPEYLWAYRGSDLFLNLIDAPDYKYIPKELIDEAVQYIEFSILEGKSVYVCCSKGESRSPSIVFLYLYRKGYILGRNPILEFSKIYPSFKPAKGMEDFILKELEQNNK